MTHAEYSEQILSLLRQSPTTVPPMRVDEQRRRNAGRCMATLACHRLAQSGKPTQHKHHSFVSWNGGLIGLRNSRIADQFWTNLIPSVGEELHSLAQEQPAVNLLVHWDMDDGVLHAWAVPEDIFFAAVEFLPKDPVTGRKTVLISPEDHQLKHAPGAPSFAPYYTRAELTEAERAKLLEAIKTDDSIKQQRLASEDEEAADGGAAEVVTNDGGGDDEPSPGFTDQTVAFVMELPQHIEDGPWHERNKRRYEHVRRDPSQAIVDQLRRRYIQRLSPVVAGGKRHLSILKKNDYGKGGYHDHYWFAFYDPAAGSKTKSVQLFVRLLGGDRVWRYGLSMGNYCGRYMERLLTAMTANRHAVADYVRGAPSDTIVRLFAGETHAGVVASGVCRPTGQGCRQHIRHGRRVDEHKHRPRVPAPDATRPHREAGRRDRSVLHVDVALLRWRHDRPLGGVGSPAPVPEPDDENDVDESAPKTIRELAELTALSEDFLNELQDALWAKQQAVLVGPPGTSKTYIARQFARYFVRQRQGQSQGSFDVLYMHANWAYEDFFEGLKPVSKDGSLAFESRLGFFLEWVAGLKDYDAKARHVLVLDEINRCDTAAVLGELLQLLEYRGTTVRLLSGRNFVFPSNLFIIGTMNSADRSIGRLDLALRRRFLWLDLHPQPETLDRWLKRPGNNPTGFGATALVRCNELLAEHGIPPEQQIGHALFMLQRAAEDDEASPKLDIPLSEKQLRQIVRFSVLPYLRELLTMQFGKADAELLQKISDLLLHCVDGQVAASESADAQPSA